MRRSKLVPVFLSLAFAAACTKAKLGAPTPNGITVALDAAVISADSGTATARVTVYEDGVVLLGEPVTLTLGGGLSGGATATTSSSSGVAIIAITGLHTAGTGTVSASTGVGSTQISASTTLTVVAGAAASITVTAPTTLTADAGSLAFATAVTDANANSVAAPVEITSTSPGASVSGNTLGNLRLAGSYKIAATVEGSLVTGTANFAVTAGAAGQVVANMSASAVARLGTVHIFCNEKDAFGNDTGGAFVAGGTTVFTTPASTITLVTGNDFTATGFTTAGGYVATCSKGAHTDTKNFVVTPQNPSNTVTASLSQTVVQAASGSTTLTCSEVDGFLNPVTATFTATLTDPSGTVSALPGGGPTYLVGALTAKGAYLATCNDAALNDAKQFSVIDTTAPAVDLALISASGPNGITGDAHYAPGATLTFRVTASDNAGIADEILSVSGPATLVGSGIHAENGGAGPFTQNFTIHVLDNAKTFAAITVSGQAIDTSGNQKIASQTFSLTTDPAAGFTVASGVTARTFFEERLSGSGFPSPIALATTGGGVYLLRTLDAGFLVEDVIRVASVGTAFNVYASDFVASAPDSAFNGLVDVPGGFGGHTLFQAVQGGGGLIDSIDAGAVNTFSSDPTAPDELAFGTVGGVTSLFSGETSNSTIQRIDSAGVSSLFFTDAGNALALDAIEVDSLGNVLALENARFSVRSIDNTGTLSGTPLLTASGALSDFVVGNGGKILTCDAFSTNELRRWSAAGADQGQIVLGLENSARLANSGGTLFAVVKSSDPAGPFVRVYKVTGY